MGTVRRPPCHHFAVALLFLAIAWTQAHCQRIIVKHIPDASAVILKQASRLKLSPVALTPGFSVLEQQGGQEKAQLNPNEVEALLEKARSWPGVQYAEQDLPRYMHLPTAEEQGPRARTAAQRIQAECREKNVALSNSPAPEYQPYGIAQIQATSSKLPNRTDNAGMLVCIIDSGIDADHPDLHGNAVDGCKYEDSFAPAGCPFTWSQDLVGHGTHVAGTIAAQRNGQGVVGVIPGPAELYAVRVFNNSGDVNQGQGLVYGSTVILAFTQCEGRLAALQVAHPEKQYRMVVSMSLGAPGPLTIERMYFKEAIKRGDILFVASSGNNGSSPTMLPDGQLTTDVNPGNYPGAYPEVIAVSAVDCANNLAPFSQKNPSVDLAAPGLYTLSTASRSDMPPGIMMGGFVAANPGITVQSMGPRASQLGSSGTGKFTGKVADCGTGAAPCPEAKDSICLVQYDPQLRQPSAAAAPTANPSRPPNAAAAAAVGRRAAGSTSPPQRAGAVGALAARLFGSNRDSIPPTRQQQQQQQQGPTKFLCDSMEFCMQQGAKAMLIAGPAISSGFYRINLQSLDAEQLESITNKIQQKSMYATFDCSEASCPCWRRIRNTARLPAVGLSLQQYGEIRAAVAAARKERRQFVGTVESKVGAYKFLSGTSMAVPHVTGAIARVWAAYPNCRAEAVRAAFEQTAKDLGPKGKDVQFGHGLVQAEAAFDYLARQPCAKGQPAGTLDVDERTQLGQ